MKQQISEETLKAMAEFFLKTSIPRILAEREGEKHEGLGKHDKQRKILRLQRRIEKS